MYAQALITASCPVYDHARRKRLLKMIATMRERMEAKLGNSNDNAFKMRKLFKMYDGAKTGMVRLRLVVAVPVGACSGRHGELLRVPNAAGVHTPRRRPLHITRLESGTQF